MPARRVALLSGGCSELLQRSAEAIEDTNFLSVFSPPDRRGQSIEDYLKRCD